MKNILFITADQLRYDCLGFQGRFPVQTPHLDALAKEGVVFDQAYCANPLCVPSRASIMTGAHSFRNGVYYNDQGWPDALPTLPEILSRNGYYNVALGKMHFRPSRRHAGFHKMVNEVDYGKYMNGKRGPKPVEKKKARKTWDEMVLALYRAEWNESNDPEDYEPVFHTNNALAELELLVKRRECTGTAYEPFFMWLSFLRPHVPCCPPPPFRDLYHSRDIPTPIRSEAEKETFSKPVRSFAKGWDCLTDEIIAEFRARYLADVSVVDHQIGRVMQQLKTLGLSENTLVIFSSDHGDYLGDHHLQQKGFFHDASSRVPLIFNGPAVEKGTRVTENVSLVDLKSTLLDYCDLLQPSLRDSRGELLYHSVASEDSVSLKPALQGGRLSAERVVICETAIYGQGIMAKHQDKKYNYYPQTGELDFFDLSDDPHEINNKGRCLKLEDLPPAVQQTFSKVVEFTTPLQSRSYCMEEKILPMFT